MSADCEPILRHFQKWTNLAQLPVIAENAFSHCYECSKEARSKCECMIVGVVTGNRDLFTTPTPPPQPLHRSLI